MEWYGFSRPAILFPDGSTAISYNDVSGKSFHFIADEIEKLAE
jgi:hypothetical protein